jgi:hypothetical protein
MEGGSIQVKASCREHPIEATSQSLKNHPLEPIQGPDHDMLLAKISQSLNRGDGGVRRIAGFIVGFCSI